jgi:hypothetical protein
MPPERSHVSFHRLRTSRPIRSILPCAKTGSCTATNSPLFDHLVGDAEQLIWHSEAERLGGLEVDDQLVLGRRLHRKLARFCALEDTVDVFRS